MSYRICPILALFILVVISAGCHVSRPIGRSPSSATSIQDVVEAWDMHCVAHSFYACPDDVLDTLTCMETMGDTYFGSDFSMDCAGLMEAISNEVLSIIRPEPEPNDLLTAVLSDPSWYE
jgi:hypothetical protein